MSIVFSPMMIVCCRKANDDDSVNKNKLWRVKKEKLFFIV